MKVGSYNYTLPGGRQQQGTLALLLRPSGLGLLALFFSLGFYTKTLLVERDEIAEISARSVGRFISNVKVAPPLPVNAVTKVPLQPREFKFSPPVKERFLAFPHMNNWTAPAGNEYWRGAFGWEPESQIAYRIFLQQAAKRKNGKAVVVDFGSWIGPTVLLSALNNAGGRVIGIEPDRQAFSEAYHNIKLNAEGKNKGVVANTIELYHLCISDKEGELEMFGAPGDSMSTLMPTENDKNKKGYTSWKVECQTLDGFLSDGAPKSNIVPVSEGGTFVPVDPADIAFLKIDTESHERFILPALKPWLVKHKPTMLLSLHFALFPRGLEPDFEALLRDIFSAYRYVLVGEGRDIKADSSFQLGRECGICTLLLTSEAPPAGQSWPQVFQLPSWDDDDDDKADEPGFLKIFDF